MLEVLIVPDYIKVSRRSKLIFALLAGISFSVLAAGFFLSRRRRRYRAISATSSDVRLRPGTRAQGGHSTLTRSSTFQQETRDEEKHHEKQLVMTSNEANSLMPNHLDLTKEHVTESAGAALNSDPHCVEDVDCDGDSLSSSGSFHSTVESLDEPVLKVYNGMYLSAMELARKGGITCRNIRTQMLNCQSDYDFLAKVHCVRLAFDEIVNSSDNREYFKITTRQVVSSFLLSTNKDPSSFCHNFDDIADYLETDNGWKVAVKELTKRKVACMNVYDIALDFVLLDAFDDMDNPPSAIVAVLQNSWITDRMKQSMVSAAIWSLLKAKTRLLRHRDGFMSRFYVLSESVSPTLAWGFLGTDQPLKDKCFHFKTVIMTFVRSIFSQDSVNYSSVHTLADDILRLAKQTADNMNA